MPLTGVNGHNLCHFNTMTAYEPRAPLTDSIGTEDLSTLQSNYDMNTASTINNGNIQTFVNELEDHFGKTAACEKGRSQDSIAAPWPNLEPSPSFSTSIRPVLQSIPGRSHSNPGSCDRIQHPLPKFNEDVISDYLGVREQSKATEVNLIPEQNKTKVVKVFGCPYIDCPFTASSRKDYHRHLAADKHRDNESSGSGSWNRFYCTVPGCKYEAKGFSRRDNFSRHMSMVHGEQLGKEKRGRKRRAA
ncbi:hypothetical protein F5Y19DRAFT_237418 [Xylariaceae sp. FL1651]|nr:hypothetical protein F5Y19DRAFT_237418 [Xylariaceae sp. FL1651]